MRRLWAAFKLWVAGRSRGSRCWLGQHPWDYPGGHCEKCGRCDEFLGRHCGCRALGRWPFGGWPGGWPGG